MPPAAAPSPVSSAVSSTGVSRSSAPRAAVGKVPWLRLHVHQMVVVRHQQNGVARRHAEQSDEADHGAQGQRAAGQGDRRHAADQRARQRQQHQQHVPGMPERQRQQQHDEHEARRPNAAAIRSWRRSAPRPRRRSAKTRPAAAAPLPRSRCAPLRRSRPDRRPSARRRRSGGAVRPDDRPGCAPGPW